MKRFFIFIILLSAVSCVKEKKSDFTYANLDSKANTIMHTGRMTAMKPLTALMVHISDSTHDAKYLALAKSWLGSYYNEIGDFTSSQKELFEAKKTYEKLHNEFGACFTEKEIGVFYKYLGQYNNALEHLRSAISILPNVANDTLSIESNLPNRIYTHIAECYMRRKLFDGIDTIAHYEDTVLRYVQLSIDTRKSFDPYGTCRTLFVQSMHYYADNPTVAEAFLKQCLDSSTKYDVSIPYMESSYLYADYCYKKNDFPKAKQYAILCNFKAKETDKKQYIIKSASILYKAFSEMSRMQSDQKLEISYRDSAVTFLKEKETYLDSVINYYKEEQVEIRTTEEKLQQSTENEHKLKERKEVTLMSTWISLIVIVVFMIFFLFYRLRKTYALLAERRMVAIITISIFIGFELVIILAHSVFEYGSLNPIIAGALIITTAFVFEQMNHAIKDRFKKYADSLHPIKAKEIDEQIKDLQTRIEQLKEDKVEREDSSDKSPVNGH